MISEAFTYCQECYQDLKERKKRKRFRRKEKKSEQNKLVEEQFDPRENKNL